MAFVHTFVARADVIQELLHGRHRHNLEAWQCTSCPRLHVRIRSAMLTPFSGELSLPEGTQVDVDKDWRRGQAAAATVPVCPADGTAMIRLDRDHPVRFA